jgi:WD40 repeat protein
MSADYEWDVYVSYSRRDEVRVGRLADRLRAAGLRVWLDRWMIRPGTDIPTAIEDGLERSRTLVLCMSKGAFDSDWVALERNTAIFRDPENRHRRFIPVLLEDCAVRDTIRRYAYVDLKAEREEALADLIEACRPPVPATPRPSSSWRVEKIGELESNTVEPLRAIACMSDGRRVVLATARDLALYDLETGERLVDFATTLVNACALGPNDAWVLTGSEYGVLRRWDLHSGLEIPAFKRRRQDSESSIKCLALFDEGRQAVTGDGNGNVLVWDLERAEKYHGPRSVAWETPTRITGIAVAPDGRTAFTACRDSVIRVWDLEERRCIQRWPGHTAGVSCIALDGVGGRALSGSADSMLRLWDVATGQCQAVFEGHAGWITSVCFSPDGRLALSSTTAAGDGARVWNVETGNCVWHNPAAHGVAVFTSDGKGLLTGMRGGKCAIWRLHPQERQVSVPGRATPQPVAPSAVRYSNAKIVLLGESSVGKTGLRNRLVRDVYEKTDSTHGMYVERLDLPIDQDATIQREAWIWDLAGQDDYRLIHQLFLDETALALMVVNPQADDPFAGVGDWLKGLRAALRNARRVPPKLLVAGRIDVGGMKVSDEKIRRLCAEHGFAEYVATSAKTGEGCSDGAASGPSALKQLIAAHIPWADLPFIATDGLLRAVKEAVLDRARRPDAALVRLPELCQQIEAAFPAGAVDATEVRKAVKLLGNQGVILPFDFGDLVLLRPEVLNRYAAAVIRGARDHKDQIGCVAEADVLGARLDWTGVDRLEPADEALLLRALLQTFLDRSLCLLEDGDGGRQLVFPSQFRRDRPLVQHPETLVGYTFAGELPTVFATLVVRLSHSASVRHKEIWQNAAEFVTPTGGTIGFVVDKLAEGTGRICVFAEAAVSMDARVVFLEYVHQHLRRTAVDLMRERRYVCTNPKCGEPVRDLQAVRKRLAAGEKFIRCVYCDKKVALVDEIERRAQSDDVARAVRELDARASQALDYQARDQILIGHMMAISGEAGELYRTLALADDGVDGEIEFNGLDGRPSGKRIHVVLNSGDRVLSRRDGDGKLIFGLTDRRVADRWLARSGDVYLIVRTEEGEIRWKNLTAFLKGHGGTKVLEIPFVGEPLTAFTLMRARDRLLPLRAAGVTTLAPA